MEDGAAVNVPLLWDEVQSGDLGEGPLFVGVGDVDAASFRHLLSIPGPGDVDGTRVEARHKADQRVLLRQLDFFFGVDHGSGGRICRNASVTLYVVYFTSTTSLR